jgi:NCK-associated protein 1
MSKFPEKLIVLNELADGVLARAASVKRLFDSEDSKPKFLTDTGLQKVVQALTKAFPDVPSGLESTPGHDQLQMRARELFDTLQEVYLTFFDALQLSDAALDVMKTMAETVVSFSMDANPDLMVPFMNLLVRLVKVHIVLGRVRDRRPSLAMYGRAFQVLSGSADANFPKLATFAVELDSPLRRVQDELARAQLPARIGATLSTVAFTFSRAVTPAVLRKEHALNPVPKTGSISDPITDPLALELRHVPDYYDWTVFGLLACPLEIPDMLEQWRTVLNEGFVATVHGAETILVHREFEDAIALAGAGAGGGGGGGGKGGKLATLKKPLAEAAGMAVGMSGSMHRERRTLLCMELGDILNVYSDTPGLLGPKFDQLLAALSLARMEVEWYFRHYGATPPKSKAKHREEDFRDENITYLVHLIDRITALAAEHTAVVQRYHVEFLTGLDLSTLKAAFAACTERGSWERGVAEILQQSCDDCGRMNPAYVAQGKSFDVADLRLNWLRVLGHFSSSHRAGGTSHAAETALCAALTTCLRHARAVDLIEEQVADCGSLAGLYHYKDVYFRTFETAIESGGEHPSHALSLIRVLDQYHRSAHPFLPDERAAVGKESVQLAIRFLRALMTRIEKLLGAINGLHGFEQLRRQVAPMRAIYILRQKDGYRAPGYESGARERHKLDNFRKYQQNLALLCGSIRGAGSLIVYDHEFVPREWVHTLVALSMRKFLNSGMDGLGNILRPSIVERACFDYITALTQVEAHVNIDVCNIVCKGLLEQFCDLSLTGLMAEELEAGVQGSAGAGSSSSGSSSSSGAASSSAAGGGDADGKGADGKGGGKDGTLYIRRLSDWFIKFLTRTVPQGGIVYSENRRAFISQIGAEFRAEEFVDRVELRSLCGLVGPYGVRAIDHDLLVATFNFARNIKAVIYENRALLAELSHKYTDEEACTAVLRQIKGIDSALSASVSIGCCLKLRQLLQQTLSDVASKRIPVFQAAVRNAYSQYNHPPELRGVPAATALQFARMDQTASDAGLRQGNTDAAFRAALSSLNASDADAELWNLFPYLAAAMFTSSTWKDAEYHVTVEAHLKNLHTMAATFHSLIEMMTSISAARAPESAPYPPATDFLLAFVQCASSIVLRAPRDAAPSLIIFMDRFLAATSPLPKAVLDACFPYNLIRTTYLEMFDRANAAPQADAASVDAEFARGF